MEMLEGRALDEAVARAHGHKVEWMWCEQEPECGEWRVIPNQQEGPERKEHPWRNSEYMPCIVGERLEWCFHKPVRYHETNNDTWAVVDGLGLDWLQVRKNRGVWWVEWYQDGERECVTHPDRNTTILNMCLRAMEGSNG